MMNDVSIFDKNQGSFVQKKILWKIPFFLTFCVHRRVIVKTSHCKM